MDDRYVAWFLNLTTLEPESSRRFWMRLREEVTLADLSLNPAVVWDEQRGVLAVRS